MDSNTNSWKPKRLLKNFKTVENKPRNLNQINKWQIDYLKRKIFRYEEDIRILDSKEKTARLKLNKAKKEIKNLET